MMDKDVLHERSALASRTLSKVLRRPDTLLNYARCRFNEVFFWEQRFAGLREPKKRSAFPRDDRSTEEVLKALDRAGVVLEEFVIEVDDYRDYLDRADYSRFPEYFGGGLPVRLSRRSGKASFVSKQLNLASFTEKSLEHYLAVRLLELSPDDVYIDIANDYSPVPEIYRELAGCNVYRQDISFPEGMHGNVIGGNAGDLPLGEGFATKMALHCSFGHFEGDSDIRFIREAGRALQKNGRLCILPLYLFTEYAVQTNPALISRGSPCFESDAVLYCTKGWSNRHGRVYDVPHLLERIVGNMEGLELKIYVLKNEKAVSPDVYLKFAAIFVKNLAPGLDKKAHRKEPTRHKRK